MSDTDPPNGGQLSFLLFVVDQLRASHTGFGGDPIVQTPHLDALAAEGCVFDRTYVANPICMPNRASIATGTMPSVHGTRVNGISLDPRRTTFTQVLAEHGWSTAAVGKVHHQNMDGDPGDLASMLEGESRGPTAGAAVRTDRVAERHDWEDMSRHTRERIELPEDYYGYQHVDLVVGHSDYATGHYYHWARERGLELDDIRGRDKARRRYEGWEQVYQSRLPEELYPTTYVTERAIARLETLARASQPFFLFCSYPDPHHPFTPPGRYYDMHDPRDVVLPETFDDPHIKSAPHLLRLLGHRGRQSIDPFHVWAPTEQQLRYAAAAEYGMISMLDDGIGQVLATVERLGLADSTVVMFTSDHGDMLGDHGLLLKGFSHYEACVRVPLVIRAPMIDGGRRISALAGSIDLAPTVLELAGCPRYFGLQGHSLGPLLRGEETSVRDHVLIEEDELVAMPGLRRPPRMRTIVADDARLTVYVGAGEGELFDHSTDPQELDNRYADSAAQALRGELTERLASSMAAHEDIGRMPTSLG